MFSKYYWRKKGLITFLLISNLFAIINGLNCYDCFWDDSPETIDERMEELALLKDRKFPVSDHYIGTPDRPRPPSGDEVRKECMRVSCKSEDHSCLKWSYITNSPKNITYMCVGNPQKRYGCFQQEIKSKDIKQYLKVEACLCDVDYCNVATLTNNVYQITLYSILATLFTITYLFELT